MKEKTKFFKKGKEMTGKIQPDPRFELVKSFYVTVPEDYNPDNCLNLFSEEHHMGFSSFSYALSDKHYCKVTTRLVSSQKLRVSVVRINENVSWVDCLTYLKKQKALLVGAQGMTLVWKQRREELPARRTLSLDKKLSLYKDAKDHYKIPSVRRFGDGKFDWFGSRFDYLPLKGFHILSFHPE